MQKIFLLQTRVNKIIKKEHPQKRMFYKQLRCLDYSVTPFLKIAISW